MRRGEQVLGVVPAGRARSHDVVETKCAHFLIWSGGNATLLVRSSQRGRIVALSKRDDLLRERHVSFILHAGKM
jgi:hypothetical protein